MSTDVYVPAHGWTLHMAWCDDTHSRDRACLLQATVDSASGDSSVLLSLVGVHCDDQRLRVDGDVTTVEGLHQLVHTLAQLEDHLTAGLTDIDCDAHPDLHTDEDGNPG